MAGKKTPRQDSDSGKLRPYGVESDAKLKKAFPKDIAPPALLFDFAAWLRGKPWGAIGAFDLTAAEQIDKFLPPEVSENNNFAMFFWLPDGGLAGLWFAATRDAASAPFVHMDSEGEFRVLAPSFALFLQRLADGLFSPDKAEADFLTQGREGSVIEDDIDPPDLTAALGQWLRRHPRASKTINAATKAERRYRDNGKAQAWLDKLVDEVEAQKKNDPSLKLLADTLRTQKIRPPGAGRFWCESFRVFAAGSTMVIRRGALLTPQKNVDKLLKKLTPALEKVLTAPLFAVREAHAKRCKGQGLWPSATVSVFQDGLVNVHPNYDHELAIGFSGFSPTDFAADQKRYPRAAANLAPWHKALIEKGKTKK